MKKLVLFLFVLIGVVMQAQIMQTGETEEAQYPETVEIEEPTLIEEGNEGSAPVAAGVVGRPIGRGALGRGRGFGGRGRFRRR